MGKSKIKKTGRPTVMTLEVLGKLLEGFRMSYNVAECCAYVGISKDTYYDYVKKNKKFSDDVAMAMEYPFRLAKHTIMKNMDKPEMARWFLEKRRKDEFGEVKKIEIDSVDQKYAKMSAEEKMKALLETDEV